MNNTQAINIDTTNDLPKRKTPKELRNSVFRFNYSWKTWRGFWNNIVYFFRCWRPAWDRATKGYCRMDTWDADYSITTYLINVLIEYRNSTDGGPDGEFATFEEWIAFIDEIIDDLIYSIEDPDKLNKYNGLYDSFAIKNSSEWNEVEREVFDKYIEEVKLVYDKQRKARERAFVRLGIYLPHIWW